MVSPSMHNLLNLIVQNLNLMLDKYMDDVMSLITPLGLLWDFQLMLLAVHLRQYNHEVMVIGSSSGLFEPVETRMYVILSKHKSLLGEESFVLPIFNYQSLFG